MYTKKKRFKVNVLKFAISKLLENYTHIGFKQQYTNHYFRKAVMGTYSSISIIDPSRTASLLRTFSKFFTRLIIVNQRVCFVGYSLHTAIQKRLHFYGNFFIYNNWPAGLITNFRRIIRTQKVEECGFFRYIPSALILFDLPPQKSFDIVNEAKTFLIPTFTFTDSNSDLSLYPYWVPVNLKSWYSRTFLLNYITTLFAKTVVIKKAMFFKNSIIMAKEMTGRDGHLKPYWRSWLLDRLWRRRGHSKAIRQRLEILIRTTHKLRLRSIARRRQLLKKRRAKQRRRKRTKK